MKRMLLNATQAEELRVAITDGQKLIDFDIETLGQEQRKGNIYKCTIERIESSLEACFVSYGAERHGFLPFKEVHPDYYQNHNGKISGKVGIKDVLKEGQTLLVQVEKDERGNKGAALTTYVSLAGRYLVLFPNSKNKAGEIGISHRLTNEERDQLRETLSALDLPDHMGLIARTEGGSRPIADLEWDLEYLKNLWNAIVKAGKVVKSQSLIYQESPLIIRAMRDYYTQDIEEVLIDNAEVFEKVYQFASRVMPAELNKIKRYDDPLKPLYSRFQLEQQIENIFSRKVPLPSGGEIVIDHTEALVSIDVNSARANKGDDIEETAFQTNMEAAEEICRQMRLRDLGGLIVIDFIDMYENAHKNKLCSTLYTATQQDRARISIEQRLSKFGLMEISRQRLRISLHESTHSTCPRCNGTGVIRDTESSALHILRLIHNEAFKPDTAEVRAQIPVDIAAFFLNEKRTEIFELEEKSGTSIQLIPNKNLETPHYQIERVNFNVYDKQTEEGVLPSYKQVITPAETSVATRKVNPKQVQQPAVPNMGNSTILPSRSLFSKIKRALRRWFETQPEHKTEITKPKPVQPTAGKRPINKKSTPRKATTKPITNNANKPNNKVTNKSPKVAETPTLAPQPVAPTTAPKTAPETKETKIVVKKSPPKGNTKAKAARNNAPKVNNLPTASETPVVVNIAPINRSRQIRRASDIIDNIKYRAIVNHVRTTSARIAPITVREKPTEKTPAIRKADDVIKQIHHSAIVHRTQNIARKVMKSCDSTVETPKQQPVTDLPPAVNCTYSAPESQRLSVENQADVLPLRQIETDPQWANLPCPADRLPSGKRRSQLPRTEATDNAPIVLQQVETRTENA